MCCKTCALRESLSRVSERVSSECVSITLQSVCRVCCESVLVCPHSVSVSVSRVCQECVKSVSRVCLCESAQSICACACVCVCRGVSLCVLRESVLRERACVWSVC